MAKGRVKHPWFQIVAVETRFSGDVYQQSFCLRVAQEQYAKRGFWLRFIEQGALGRVKSVEIVSVQEVKKLIPATIKRLVDSEYLESRQGKLTFESAER